MKVRFLNLRKAPEANKLLLLGQLVLASQTRGINKKPKKVLYHPKLISLSLMSIESGITSWKKVLEFHVKKVNFAVRKPRCLSGCLTP